MQVYQKGGSLFATSFGVYSQDVLLADIIIRRIIRNSLTCTYSMYSGAIVHLVMQAPK